LVNTHETPSPGEFLGEDAADDWTQRVGHCDDTSGYALVLATVLEGNDIRDDDHGQSKDPAASQSLYRTEDDELDHCLRQRAGKGAQQKDDE
jgi:hypothetical protein